MKKVLLVITTSPYGSLAAQEALDAALVFAVFGNPVSLWLSGKAAWMLMPDQQSSAISRKSLGEALKALPLYDIERRYVSRDDLPAIPLPEGWQTVSPEDEVVLMAEHEVVIRL